MSEGNTLKDKFNFGKNRGKIIGDVLKSDVSYLCWMRDEVLKDKNQSFFDAEANRAIDEKLEKMAKSGSKLRGRFRNWTTDPPDFDSIKAAKVEHIGQAAKDNRIAAIVGENVRFAGYDQEWGAW